MKNIKRVAATTALALVAVVGLSAPAAAAANNSCTTSGPGSSTVCTAVDSSTAFTVNGNCSGIIQTSVSGDNTNLSGNGSVSGNVGVGNTTTTTQTNTSTQGNTATVTFSPNCSTTNVTQQVASAATDRGAQVVAPRGGVHAGAGGSQADTSNVASIVGLASSVGAAGFGLALRRKAQLDV